MASSDPSGKANHEVEADLALLARVKEAIDATPYLQGPAISPPQIRAVKEAVEVLYARLRPDLTRLVVLRDRWLPTACLPSACGFGRFADRLEDLVVQFINCDDLCERCRGEALREVDGIAAAIHAGRPGPPFLPPEIARGRIDAANERVRSANERFVMARPKVIWRPDPLVQKDSSDCKPTRPIPPLPSQLSKAENRQSSPTNLWQRFAGRSATKENFLRLVNLFPRDFVDAAKKRQKTQWANYVTENLTPTHRPTRKGAPSYYRVEQLRREFVRLAWPVEPLRVADAVDRWTCSSDAEIADYTLTPRD